MRSIKSFHPPFSWWIRSGERLCLGLDIRLVLDGEGAGIPERAAIGLFVTREWIQEGFGLVDSLRRAGLVIPEEAWCLLESGERTGRLGEAMGEVGNFIRQSESARREFISQIWYPVIVLLTGFLVMGLILFWVVPQMQEISRSMGQEGELPWLTEHIGVLYGSIFTSIIALAILGILAWSISGYLGKTSLKWATFREKAAALIPFWGSFRKSRREARILRQVGTLLHGGVTLPSALEVAARHSKDRFEEAALEDFRKRLLMGASFEDSLRVLPLVRKWNQPILVTGQESGRLDYYLLQAATDLDKEVSWQLKQLMRAMEPSIILVLAVFIAGLVLAYILPTIRMMEQLA